MAALRDALYLVNRARFYTGVYDHSLLRDGFSDDIGEADRDILTAVNEAIQELLKTGQFKCKFFLSLTSGVQEYTLDQGIGEVDWVTYQECPIRKIRMTVLDRKYPGWRLSTTPLGAPRYWYNDMPDVLGLFPIPSGSDPDCNTSSLKLLAESLTDDLVNKTDVPARLPSQFHDDIPIGAACRILESLGDEISIARRSMLLPRWFSPGDPYNQAAVQRVQALAQQRNRAEVSQAEPMEYRDQYAIGIPNYTGDGWWQNDEQY